MRNQPLSLLVIVTAIGAAHGQNHASKACILLQEQLPGLVHFPGSTQYLDDISHWAPSSTQNSTCSVEPSTIEDVSTILKIVGRDDVRSPFAIKGGGHASNSGFSSTLGVQIAMSRFNDLDYDSQTVKFGSGLTWDQVYQRLDPFNVTVVGGRVPGVGFGLLLGGGYSWVTDQYGLGIDNTIAYDLVLPNGTYVEVTELSQPDLFFALKGGLNNFGIVTAVTVKAHPLSQIWGGVITYSGDYKDAFFEAVANFSLNNSDPKAQMIAFYGVTNGQAACAAFLFYAEPKQPEQFQPFLEIPSQSGSSGIMSLSSFLALSPINATSPRVLQDVIPITKYTVSILDTIATQVNLIYDTAISNNRSFGSVFVNSEPFLNPFVHSTPSAYPHSASHPVTPANSYVEYSNEADFEYVQDVLRNLTLEVQAVAIQEGQSTIDALHYPNYALGDTPLELMYGDNVERLRRIKADVDPKNVMGLTGGFMF